MNDENLKQFVRRLKKHDRQRIDLTSIWKAYHKVYGQEMSGVDARNELKDILDRLNDNGECAFPSEQGRGWDRTSAVPLPKWVTLPRDADQRSAQEWRAFPWHPSLSWVSELPTLTTKQEEFLMQLQRALVDGRLKQRAPFKYRSLQLTGNEKQLEEFRKTQLFDPGRISEELLNCDGLGLPLAYERVSAEPKMIIFENAGSFLVARRALIQTCNSPYGAVAYGGGNQIMRCVDYLSEIDGIAEIEYVGDLDAKGIDIGMAFAELARDISGASVTPATQVHMAMLEAAEELGSPDGWPSKSAYRTAKTHHWLSPKCADKVAHIIQSGNRIPEEVLHYGHYRRLWMRD